MALRPQTLHAALAAVTTLGLTAGLLALVPALRAWALALLAFFVAVNAVAFVWYGYDKRQARQAGRRVPEVVLHGLAFAGGSLGAYAGMRMFRHKTIKGRFRIVFWWIVVMQVALVGTLLYRAVRG